MKNLLIALLCLLPSVTLAQESKDFPYSEIFSMTPAQLKAAKYRYYSNDNKYVFAKRKTVEANNNAPFIRALDIKDPVPNESDYIISVYLTDESEVAMISVEFYSAEHYQEIYKFGRSKGTNIDEVEGNNNYRLKYDYGGYYFDLFSSIGAPKMEDSSISKTDTNNLGTYKNIDSYGVFKYKVKSDKTPSLAPVKKQKPKRNKSEG